MSTVSTDSKGNSFDTLLLVRIMAASILFAVSLVLNMPAFLRIILLAVSAAAAGYDVALKAIDFVLNKAFFATPIVIIFVALVSFFIGCSTEGAALIILYQLGLMLISYAQEHMRQTAVEQLRHLDRSTIDHISVAIADNNATRTAIGSELEHSAGLVLKCAIAFAFVYAVVLPLFTSYSYTLSIHRALVIILVSTTGSIVASMPPTSALSMCMSAGQGVIPGNVKSLEALSAVKTAVFDKSGIFSESTPRVISAQSSILDKDTFAAFAAHAVYYSDQPFARAVSALYNKDYKLEVISGFVDIPGSGVDLSIGGAHVTFAKRELFASRGVSVPAEMSELGQVYYMTVADKYVGKVTVSNGINTATQNLVAECKSAGVEKCILLTEDGRGESAAFAEEMQFTELFSQCDTADKLKCIRNIKDASDEKVMYVYSNGIQTHSAADIDVRVNAKARYADILLLPDYISNLPYALELSSRLKEVSTTNALIAFVIKAILIFFAIIGYCNIWLAIVIDMAAAIGTILNSSRVAKESVVSVYKYKTGK